VEEAIKMQSIVDQSSEEGGLRLLVASLRSADELAELAAGVRVKDRGWGVMIPLAIRACSACQ
jgi:hypothetical protein